MRNRGEQEQKTEIQRRNTDINMYKYLRGGGGGCFTISLSLFESGTPLRTNAGIFLGYTEGQHDRDLLSRVVDEITFIHYFSPWVPVIDSRWAKSNPFSRPRSSYITPNAYFEQWLYVEYVRQSQCHIALLLLLLLLLLSLLSIYSFFYFGKRIHQENIDRFFFACLSV